jgi:VanZ family protein
LVWLTGFALAFGSLFGFLFAYSLAQPSLWLPIVFGIAFYGLLSSAPRMTGRAGLSILFGSVSCILWMASGSEAFYDKHGSLRFAFQVLLGIGACIGFFMAVAAYLKAPPKAKPVMGAAILLMLIGWVISYFSSSHGGASPMIDWASKVFGLDRNTAETIIIAIRKTGHFCGYALIASVGFAMALQNGAVRKICFIGGIVTALTFAIFDEVRQSTQVDRGGSAWDVALDMSGATCALGGISLLGAKKRAVRPKTARTSSTL